MSPVKLGQLIRTYYRHQPPRMVEGFPLQTKHKDLVVLSVLLRS